MKCSSLELSPTSSFCSHESASSIEMSVYNRYELSEVVIPKITPVIKEEMAEANEKGLISTVIYVGLNPF